MIAAARPGIRHNVAAPPTAPAIRQSATFSRTIDGGSTAFGFSANTLVHSGVLILIAEQGSGIASLTGPLGTSTQTQSQASGQSAVIGWLADCAAATQFLVTYNGGFHNIDGVCYEITGLSNSFAVLSSFTEAATTTIATGGSWSASLTATAAGQLAVMAFCTITDTATAPTWTESPAGPWTRSKDINNHFQSGDFVLTGGSGTYSAGRDFAGVSASNIRVATLIG